jgi:OmpA family
MRALMLSVAVLALMAPAAYAQSTNAAAPPQVEGPGQYMVFFPWNQATLSEEDRQIVDQAAAEYRQTGSTRITITGHTDTSGSAAYNLELSQRRAEAVAAEMIRQGVPAGEIETIGRGEEDLLVPTADGVREPRNRRVVIEFPVPPPAPPPAPAPMAEAVPPPEPPPPPRYAIGLGALYGHNFGETDDDTENELAGVNLEIDGLFGSFGKVTLNQAVLNSFNGVNNGVNGRTALGIGLTPVNLIFFQPYLSVNVGGVYGAGVQDGFIAGPELGFQVNMTERMALRAKLAYDYQFRNPGDFDKGIAWAGLGLGYRF